MRTEAARSIPFASRTLPGILKLQAERCRDKLLIMSQDHSITYAEAPDIAARSAGRLAAAGVGAGDRVITFLSNGVDLIELWFGAAWLGAVLTPINTAFRDEQLRHALAVADPVLIVTERELLEHLYNPSVELSTDTRVWVTDIAHDHSVEPSTNTRAPDTDISHNHTVEPSTNTHSPATGIAGAADLETNRQVSPLPPLGEPLAAHAAQPGDPIAILYTSGTSGPSKGVVCPHAQFFWWGVLTGESLQLSSEDVLFTTLPFFHTNALNTIWQALLTGATYTFTERFSASRFWAQAQQAGATVTYLLGAMVHILLKAPPGPADRDHRIRIALSPATAPELVEQFHDRFGIRLVEGYGSTETNLVMSNQIGEYSPGTMGRVVEGFEVRVVDEHDNEVPAGTPGELIIRHSEPFSVANGYFGNPEATASAWRNLWFHTGDRVVCDERGVYHFLDRIKDAIRRRGENISSWEVEQALLTHSDIKNAAVVGVPAEVGEEDVMAFIIPRDGSLPEPKDVIQYLENRIARFAIPRYLEFVDELPLTENGKVKKYILKERGTGPATWDRDK